MSRMTYKYVIKIGIIRYGSAWGYQNAYNLKRRALRKYKNQIVTMTRVYD